MNFDIFGKLMDLKTFWERKKARKKKISGSARKCFHLLEPIIAIYSINPPKRAEIIDELFIYFQRIKVTLP